MIDKFSPIEIGIYMAIKEKNPAGYSVPVSLPNDQGVFMVKAIEHESKIKTKIENGKPKAVFEVNVEAMIEEEIESNQLDLSSIREIEKQASKKVNQMADKFLKQLQNDKSVVFGLGAKIRAKYPSYWDNTVKTDENWAEIYKDMDIQIDYNVSIRRTGMEWKLL
ncbi:Ger(x)C family spore germination C-terminal domain-containing protein [Paucisalibacillus sp. EB02]|uniref:Ger(x)C family spore germination C-terminal domain-containing protein n=1 Tax=Paucisalibacillus sp. EB02 TaxID=1347087 RepID=UPI000694C5BE|nr:Ger(x)C family spore germination C-terminal domain-containing protein [Paucisalibacillus sp. EB02]